MCNFRMTRFKIICSYLTEDREHVKRAQVVSLLLYSFDKFIGYYGIQKSKIFKQQECVYNRLYEQKHDYMTDISNLQVKRHL